MARNLSNKPPSMTHTFAGALVASALSAWGTMRGFDELEALRFDNAPVPEGGTRVFWDYEAEIVIRAEFKRRNPPFFSSRWLNLLDELNQNNRNE